MRPCRAALLAPAAHDAVAHFLRGAPRDSAGHLREHGAGHVYLGGHISGLRPTEVDHYLDADVPLDGDQAAAGCGGVGRNAQPADGRAAVPGTARTTPTRSLLRPLHPAKPDSARWFGSCRTCRTNSAA